MWRKKNKETMCNIDMIKWSNEWLLQWREDAINGTAHLRQRDNLERYTRGPR